MRISYCWGLPVGGFLQPSTPPAPLPPSHLRHVFMAATTHETSMTCGLIEATRRPRNPSGVAQGSQKPVGFQATKMVQMADHWVKHQQHVISGDLYNGDETPKQWDSSPSHTNKDTTSSILIFEMKHFLPGSTLQPNNDAVCSAYVVSILIQVLPAPTGPIFGAGSIRVDWQSFAICVQGKPAVLQDIYSGAFVSKAANLDELHANFVHFQSLFVCHSLYIISMTYLFYSILHCILDATQQHHVSYIGLVLLVTLGHAPLAAKEHILAAGLSWRSSEGA